MPRRILYTRHARRRMVLRGISRREVEDAIRRGAKRTEDDKVVATYSYFEVVYIVRGADIRVVTVKPRW